MIIIVLLLIIVVLNKRGYIRCLACDVRRQNNNRRQENSNGDYELYPMKLSSNVALEQQQNIDAQQGHNEDHDFIDLRADHQQNNEVSEGVPNNAAFDRNYHHQPNNDGYQPFNDVAIYQQPSSDGDHYRNSANWHKIT